MLGKKGEISSSVIIRLVILILSFVAILILLGNLFLNDSGTTNRAVCKESVILRNSLNIGPLEGSKVIPLKCKTEEICITDSKGDCGYSKGEESFITKIKVSNSEKNKEQVKEDILDTFSEAIVNCDSMLGSGDLNFLPSNWGKTDYCIVCARISTEDKVSNAFPDGIDYMDLYKYMESKKVGDSNYLEIVYDKKYAGEIEKDFLLVQQQVKNGEVKVENENIDLRYALDDWKFDVGTEQAILVRATKEGNWKAKIGGASAGGLVATTFVGAGVGAGLLLSSTGVGAIIGIPMIVSVGAFGATIGTLTTIAAGGITYSHRLPGNAEYMPPIIIPYDIDSLKLQGCDSFENIP